MTLPQFWFVPLAYLLEEMAAPAAGAGHPKMREPAWEVPPGGAWRRVVGRSVMTLPQFWSEPLAKALDDCDTGVGMRGAVSASRDC